MIFVDDLRERGWLYGPSCHLISDDISEAGLVHLHRFAAAIGLEREWFQPKSFPHYDLSARYRKMAIDHGARPVSSRTLVEIMQRARDDQRRRWLDETTENLRCSCCGALYDFRDPSWRTDGVQWEHKCAGNHPQAGYFAGEQVP